jgi:hypothetical protein
MPTAVCRGPAKGYIEGLEHRLRETESLLLQLLPVVAEDYLEAVTTDHEGSPSRNTTTPRRPMLNNKTGVEYWEQYPLDSLENIRRWQQDCAEGRSSYRNSAQSSQERLPSANLDTDPIEPVERPLSRYRQSMPSSAEVVISPEDLSTPIEQIWLGTNATSSNSMLIGQTAPNNFGMASWNQVKDMNMRVQFQRDSSEAYSGLFEPDRAKELREGPFYLSDFQRQFFW